MQMRCFSYGSDSASHRSWLLGRKKCNCVIEFKKIPAVSKVEAQLILWRNVAFTSVQLRTIERIAEKSLPGLHGKNPIFKSLQRWLTAINLTESCQILDNFENPVTSYIKCECWNLTVF